MDVQHVFGWVLLMKQNFNKVLVEVTLLKVNLENKMVPKLRLLW